jgi:hypothetical protein
MVLIMRGPVMRNQGLADVPLMARVVDGLGDGGPGHAAGPGGLPCRPEADPAIRESATSLLDELEQFMGGDLVEALCLWREAAQKMQDRRTREPASADSVHQLRARKVS